MCNCNIINSMCLMFPIYFVFLVAISTTRVEVQVQAFGVGRGWGRVFGKTTTTFPVSSSSQASNKQTSKGKSSFAGARAKSKPKGTSGRGEKTMDNSDDDLHVLEVMNMQQQRSEQIQLKIAEQLNRDEQSPIAVWGSWLGVMAGRKIDERLHERFYRESMDLVLALAAESKQLPALHPPNVAQQQQYQQPQPFTQTFTQMLAPQTWQQPQLQQHHAVDQLITHERPTSTPNSSFSNLSNCSDFLGTPCSDGNVD